MQFWAILTKNWPFETYFTSIKYLWANYHNLCHGKCCLRHIRSILNIKKLCLMGLEIQFKAPKEPMFAVFSKIGSLKAYFTSTTHLWTHFYDPCHRRCCLRHFRGIASLETWHFPFFYTIPVFRHNNRMIGRIDFLW